MNEDEFRDLDDYRAYLRERGATICFFRTFIQGVKIEAEDGEIEFTVGSLVAVRDDDGHSLAPPPATVILRLADAHEDELFVIRVPLDDFRRMLLDSLPTSFVDER